MKELKQQIKNKAFYKVYLLTGDEDYLISQAKHLLKDAMVPEGDQMNFTLYENAKIDYQELAENASTFPFFNDKRVIILDRTGVMKNGKDDFLNILKNLPETTCVIICEPETDKRSKIYKWIKKEQCVREFLKKNQTEAVLMRWLASLLAKENKKIRQADARFFLERTGNDMYQISNEAGKLISYTGEREEITTEDIRNIVSGEVQNKIFELIAAIAEGNKKKATACYHDLLILREAPMRILFLIARQYRILLVIRSMREDHKSDEQIAQAAGIPRFSVGRNAAQANHYPLRDLEYALAECVKVEEEIKTGRLQDKMGIELLIVGLSERML